MLKLTKGNDVKLIDKDSPLVERLKKDGWKSQNVKEVIEDELIVRAEKASDKKPEKKAKKKI